MAFTLRSPIRVFHEKLNSLLFLFTAFYTRRNCTSVLTPFYNKQTLVGCSVFIKACVPTVNASDATFCIFSVLKELMNWSWSVLGFCQRYKCDIFKVKRSTVEHCAGEQGGSGRLSATLCISLEMWFQAHPKVVSCFHFPGVKSMKTTGSSWFVLPAGQRIPTLLSR